MKWFFTLGCADQHFKLSRWDYAFLTFFWVCLVGLIGLIVAAVMVMTGVDHPHEHCVQQDYVHHAKVGYEWDCVKWAKL